MAAGALDLEPEAFEVSTEQGGLGIARDLLAEPQLVYRSDAECAVRMDLGGGEISGHIVDPGRRRWSLVDRPDGGGACHRLHGASGHIVFDLPEAGPKPSHLVLRGLSRGVDDVALALNGSWLDEVDFSDLDFETVAIPLRGAALPGMNELAFSRFSAQGAPSRSAGLLLSEVGVGSARCLDDRERTFWTPKSGMLIPAGEAVHFRAFLPTEALIELEARSERGPGALTWRVESDEEIGFPQKIELSSAQGAVRHRAALDRRFCGKAVVVTLRAEGGDVAVERARILAVKPAPRELPPGFGRHLFLVVVDTLRRDHLYGPGSRPKPFALDLQRASFVFESAAATDSWTKPAVASILTGLHPRRHGAVTHSALLAPEVIALPEILKDRGWKTAAFSTNGYISPRFGFDQGFDEFRSLSGRERPERAEGAVDALLGWLEGQDPAQPLMVYLHLVDPHAPYDPPQGFLCPGSPRGCPGRIPGRRTVELVRAAAANKAVVDCAAQRQLHRQYEAEIAYADRELERLYRALEGRGWLDDAVFVLTSDHGEEFEEHGSYGHGQSLHAELIDVPLLVSVGPEAGVSRVVSEPFSMVHLMPTLLDLLGVEPPEEIDGVSLFSRAQRGLAHHGIVISESPSKSRLAARRGDFKLVLSGLFYDLYELKSDPGERRDAGRRFPIASGALRDAMASFHNAHPPRTVRLNDKGAAPATSSEKIALDEETLGRLRALGYVD